MSLTAIATLIKDGLVLAVVGFLAYLLISFGENRVQKKDLKLLEQRIVENTATVARWHQEDTDANQRRDTALTQLHADVSAPRKPVVVLVPASQGAAVPAHSTPASGAHPDSGGAGSGCRGAGQEVNIRPDLDTLELKYGEALAICRSWQDKWPH